MIKPCKCGEELLVVKVRVSGLAEYHIGIDGEDFGLETDRLVYNFQATVKCARCGNRRRDLRFDKIKGLEEISPRVG